LAVEERGRFLKIQGRRETKGLNAVARESGYSKPTIIRAAEELGLIVRRAKKMNVRRPKARSVMFAFSDVQVRAIVEYLGQFPDGRRRMRTVGKKTVKGAWGMGSKPSECLGCGRKDRPHWAKGYCAACYIHMLRVTGRAKPR
jgi:hypothetical protein